jgi:Zn-dependent peptidase ImmA (M78 family)
LEQHKEIEGDADYLALAVLFPKGLFIERFNKHSANAPNELKAARDKFLIYVASKLESDFQVWPLKVAYRARDLELITDQECRKYFSDRLTM